jgi:amino acid transporter
MSATARPEGSQPTFTRLRTGVLSVPDVVFTSVATQAPGGAVALNFFFAILFAGSGFPLAMLVALVATLFLAGTLSQFAKRLSSSAGFGVYVARGLGPRAGFFTSWCALFYGYLFPAEVVVLISQVITNLLNPVFHTSVPWQVIDVIFIAVIWYLAYTGIKRSARVAILTGTIEVTIFLILGILLVVRAGSHNTLTVFTPTTGIFGLAWGLIFGFLSFTGFESVASLAEETANPKKLIGPSALFALLAVGIFYVFLAYAGVVGWGLGRLTGGSGPSYFAGDTFAYGTLASHISPVFQWVILIAVINSVIACSLAALNFAARYFYSLGRLHLLPSRFGDVQPKYKTPSFSINAMAVITLVLSLGLGSWWGPSIAFGFLATAFTYGWILMFAMANVALPFFYRREHPKEFSVVKHIVFPAIGTIALVPALFAPVLPYLPQFAAAGPVAWQLVLTVPLTLVWAVIGIVVAVTMNKERADRATHLGTDQDLAAGHPGFAHTAAAPGGE